MKTRGIRQWAVPTLVVTAFVLTISYASAYEVQLTGIRLDAPWTTVLDVFGQPDGIVQAAAADAAAGGGMAGGGMGGDMMGGGMGGMGAGMPGMGGDMMGGGMGGGGDMMGGGMGGPGGGGGGGGGSGAFPVWAQALWVVLEEGEVEWLYRKGEVVMGFVFNPDGYVRVIAVAGETCDYARTALWQPHRYVKLGDNFKRVLYRYGWPDEHDSFTGDATAGGGGGGAAPGGGGGGGMPGMGGGGDAGGMMGGMPGMGGGGGDMMGGMGGGGGAGGGGGGGGALGSITVNFGSESNAFTRDCELTYDDTNNIAFTLHNMIVTRIFIWKTAG